ncbi:MAG: sugar ABC transporter substrate-binding protein [Clostridia bacterium]|nr:sugar ABC transporter substrate-binding protein [Clostridia bacterium]MBQ8973694.1 sugar ABC transporter substrate-binding protein [Clostridia bacterium]
MRKFLSLVLVATLLMSVFAFTASADGETTITIAVSGSASEIALRKETGDLFCELNPQYSVEWIDLGDDRVTKTMTLISSGAAPDILYINENIVTYASRGVLEPLGEYVAREGEGYLDYFYPSLLALDTWQDELYALPQEVSPYLIYYNKDLFEKYGVELPTDDWTFEQWYEACKSISSAGAADGVYGQNVMGWADQALMVLSRMGVEVYNEDATQIWTAQPENYDKALEAFTFFANAYLEDKICPTPSEITAMGKAFDQAFRNQLLAMDAAGLWNLPTYLDEPLNFNWDVVMSPLSTDGTRTNRAGILNWGIYSGSNNKDAAWELLKFLTGHEGQMIVAKYNMALPSAYDEEANQLIVDSHFPENVEAFIKANEFIEQGDSFSVAEDEINTALMAELNSMVLGLESPEEALNNFNDFAVETLEEALDSIYG